MIVLKHLAQEFSMDPHRVRAILRDELGQPQGKRWKWEDDDPDLEKAREAIRRSTTTS